MTPPPTKKPPRNERHIKMRKLSELDWWTTFTADLLAFVLSGPTRSWTEITAWCKARYYTNVTIENMVAFLDLSRKIAIVSPIGALTLWGEPPPPEPCQPCRAEKETGGTVRNKSLHTCGKKEKAA